MDADLRALIFAASAAIAALSLLLTRLDVQSENERKRREYALTYSLTRLTEHIEARRALEAVFGPAIVDKRPTTLSKDETAKLFADTDLRNHLRVLLNHWDNMAIAVANQVADERTAYDMVGRTLTYTVSQYQHSIDRIQQENPVSYQHLIWLHRRWVRRDRKAKMPTLSAWRQARRFKVRKTGWI